MGVFPNANWTSIFSAWTRTIANLPASDQRISAHQNALFSQTHRPPQQIRCVPIPKRLVFVGSKSFFAKHYIVIGRKLTILKDRARRDEEPAFPGGNCRSVYVVLA